MLDDLEARQWELAEGPWQPLRGLLARIWDIRGIAPRIAARAVADAICTGVVAIRIPASNGTHAYIASSEVADFYRRAGIFAEIDWPGGFLREPAVPIDALWPDVIELVEQLGQQEPTATPPASGKPRGRKPKYDWAAIEVRVNQYFHAHGAPSRDWGERVELIDFVKKQFGDDCPAQSVIREHINRMIDNFWALMGEPEKTGK